MAGSSSSFETATAHAGPLEPSGPHRLAKRLVARLLGPFLHRQAAFNQAVLDALGEVRSAQPSPGQGGHGGVDLHQLAETVTTHGYAIEAIKASLEEGEYDRQLVPQALELTRQQAFARFHDGIGVVQGELGDLARRVGELADELVETQTRLAQGLAQQRSRLAQVDLLLDRVRRQLPQEPALAELAPIPSRLDGLYVSFEEAFRGPPEMIKPRVAAYLPDILATEVPGSVLDVGCGRGDFLSVLKEADVVAYGVEANAAYRASWQDWGLDVRVGDAVAHLASLPERSLRAVSAIHVVEHLGTERMLEFFDLALRALHPGGLLILETPNPQNLAVGASSFYLDPTHDRPLPPGLLAFLVEARGYREVEVRLLARQELPGLAELSDREWAADLRPLHDALQQHLFAPQDYAVLARRA